MGSCAPCSSRSSSEGFGACLKGGGGMLRRWRWRKRGDSLADLKEELAGAVAECEAEPTLRRALATLLEQARVQAPSEARSSARGSTRPSRVFRCRTLVSALGSLSDIDGLIGLDIGGTLAKLVIMERVGQRGSAELVANLGRRHADLTFRAKELQLDGSLGAKAEFEVHCVSGHREGLRAALAQSPLSPHSRAARRIVAAGGGAHEFAESVRTVLNVQLLPFQEMQSLVEGLEFCHTHGPDDEVFTMRGEEVAAERWPEQLYPCILVNMGSGVSILRCDGPDASTGACVFSRLGGTACGGATFLGLMRMTTSAVSFEQALRMAESGDAAGVNKLVGDIYGERGCASLGLPSQMAAAYFGKLGSMSGDVWAHAAEADCAAAVLMMVVQESVVLARAFSQVVELKCGQAPPIFFVGGFLGGNTMAQRLIARTFQMVSMRPPLFLRHADFLGALGCLSYSRQR